MKEANGMADQDVSAPGAGRPHIYGNAYIEIYQALYLKRLQAPKALDIMSGASLPLARSPVAQVF
jgi:hypothetical protein